MGKRWFIIFTFEPMLFQRQLRLIKNNMNEETISLFFVMHLIIV